MNPRVKKIWIGLTYEKTAWENGDPVTYTKWNTKRVTDRKNPERYAYMNKWAGTDEPEWNYGKESDKSKAYACQTDFIITTDISTIPTTALSATTYTTSPKTNQTIMTDETTLDTTTGSIYKGI